MSALATWLSLHPSCRQGSTKKKKKRNMSRRDASVHGVIHEARHPGAPDVEDVGGHGAPLLMEGHGDHVVGLNAAMQNGCGRHEASE